VIKIHHNIELENVTKMKYENTEKCMNEVHKSFLSFSNRLVEINISMMFRFSIFVCVFPNVGNKDYYRVECKSAVK
jgi:hypothetical protein